MLSYFKKSVMEKEAVRSMHTCLLQNVTTVMGNNL